MSDTEVHGPVNERFEGVREALRASLQQGDDVGASFCASIAGETVVDIWGGHMDAGKTRPWQQDTIVNVYSTTKTLTALCAMLLVDRGELDLDAPVAKYWPEFGAHNKGGVLVRHLLSHSAGLPAIDTPIDVDALYDWQHITGLLAAQPTRWEPGSQSGYHGLTQGYLVGEVVRRITDQSVGAFFREHIGEPFDIDFYIGLPDSEFERTADLITPEDTVDFGNDEHFGGSLAAEVFDNPRDIIAAGNSPGWRRAQIPAANGHGNARAIARVMTALACDGELDGKRLLSPETISLITEEQTDGTDAVFGAHVRWGLGFALGGGIMPLGPGGLGWGGWGGSVILIDRDAKMSAAFAMNRMTNALWGDSRITNLVVALLLGLS